MTAREGNRVNSREFLRKSFRTRTFFQKKKKLRQEFSDNRDQRVYFAFRIVERKRCTNRPVSRSETTHQRLGAVHTGTDSNSMLLVKPGRNLVRVETFDGKGHSTDTGIRITACLHRNAFNLFQTLD